MSDSPFTIYCITAPAPGGGMRGNASYRAHDRAGRAVVLHVMDADPAVLQKIDRQAEVAAKADPALVCRVIESGEWLGRHMLAVEEGHGELLRDRTGGAPVEVRDLLQAGTRLCEAVEAAHTAGATHGSLASDCVYVAPGNQIQVAGFGYAAALRGEPACQAPEAERGGDRRTDVYGIGAILWEMATGEVAPADPMPATQLRRDLPLILDGIIRTALDPDPAKRFQTTAGLAQALHHFQEGTATPERLSRAQVEGAPGRRRRRRRVRRADPKWAVRLKWLRNIALVALLATLSLAAYLMTLRRNPFQKTTLTRLTSSGDVTEAAISPDGAQVALARHNGSGYSLWTQASSGKHPVRILPPVPEKISDVAFSAAGDRIYYVTDRPGTLHSIPVQGGAIQDLARGVIAPRFSPDGRKIAFLRRVGNEETVVMAKPDGSGDTLVHARATPVEFTAVAWAPGGTMFGLGVFTPGDGSQLMTTQSDGNFVRPLGWRQWPGPISTAWLPAGEALLVVAPEAGGDRLIWRIHFPEGSAAQVGGAGDYSGVSLSTNGKSLVTVSTVRKAGIWVVPAADPAAARQITRAEGPDGVYGLDWLGPDRLVYTSEDSRGRGLSVTDKEGRNSGYILRETERAIAPRGSPDGNTIAFIWIQEKARYLWSISPEGKGMREISRMAMHGSFCYSPDGQSLYYSLPTDPALSAPDLIGFGVWRIPAGGGRQERVASGLAEYPAVSPDGGSIAYRVAKEVVVASLPAGVERTRLPAGQAGPLGWTPDGKAIVWAQEAQQAGNLWAHPLDGGAPVQLTRFTAPGRIHWFAWSRDGRSIAVSRGRVLSDAILIHDRGW